MAVQTYTLRSVPYTCSRSFNNKEDYPIRIYSALKINADYTITRNRKDFYLYDSLFRCVGTGRMILVKNSLCQ